MPILDQTGERWLTLGRDGKPITQEIASIQLDIHRVFYGRAVTASLRLASTAPAWASRLSSS